jgi:hypothetical protein
LYAPTSVTAGVPDNLPVVELKIAHDGLFAIVKLNVAPELPLACG